MRRWTKWSAAAAMLLTVGLLAILMIPAPGGVALADVRKRLDNAKTYRFKTAVSMPGMDKPMTMTVMFKAPERLRQEMPGMVSIWDMRTLQGLVLSTRNKKAQRVDLTGLPKELQEEAKKEQMDLLIEIRRLLRGKPQELGPRTIGGKKCPGYRAAEGGEEMKIWVDPKTAEPVRVEMKIHILPEKITLSDFELDPKLDDALFELKVPQGYEVLDTSKPDFKATEEQFAQGLRVLAEINGNRFPAYPTLTPELIKRMQKAGHTKEQIQQKGQAIQKAILFLTMMAGRAEEWQYVGKDVKLGDAKAPVMWWKPKKAQKPKTYRVLFGDLKFRDVTPEEKAKLIPPAPASKPASK